MKEATLQHDPNLKLPAAVRAAAARSDEIIRAMQAQPAEENGEQPAEAPAEQPAEVTSESNEPAPPAEAQPEDKPKKPKNEPKSERDSWEQRYNAMKGRYDRSQEQLKDLSEQLNNLHATLATMQAKQQATQEHVEVQSERLITEDEERDYGPEFLKVVGKKAKEELIPMVKAQAAKIAELEAKIQGVNNVVAQDAHGKLLATLDRDRPDWRELNGNPEFLNWLRLPDPFSGAIRHDMLKAAYAAGNASRVLAFFNGFLAEEAAVAPAPGDPDTATNQTVAKVPLSNFAAPGRAKSAAGNTAPAEKPIFTRAQIADFYAEVAAGKFRGKDAEKSKLEAQIFLAQREGRIR